MLDEMKLHFEEAAQKLGLPSNLIAFSGNKDRSTSVSVCIRNYPDDSTIKRTPLCRLGEGYIMVSASFIKQFPLPSGFTSSRLPISSHPYKIIWDAINPPAEVCALPSKLVAWFLGDYAPGSFGCCHRYAACSDAKKCLHPDLLYAKGCMYRKNLEAGRIFYGSNC